MRLSASCVLAASCVTSVFCTSARATPVTAPVLDIYGTSLTAHPPQGVAAFSVAPRFDQRGADIDGTLRTGVPLGWAAGADPLGGGYSSGRMLGDVNLATGSYNPTDIDLAFPTIGPPIVIGRTYNNLQQDGAGTRQDYYNPQGYNWYQVAQPQISLFTGATADLDVLYIYYGNDRFIELQRTGVSSNEFKAKNGAAGVVTYTAPAGSDPELYTYYDQAGNQTVFIGFDGNAGLAVGQLWKMVDRAGNVAYVHSTTLSTAVSTYGGGAGGRMQYMFDASGRKYAFTYSLLGGGTVHITKVEAQLYIASVWTTFAQVEYDYYTSTENDKGRSGDLRLVTITHKGVSGGDYVRRKYYRYYTRAWSNSDGRRGEARSIKMVVGFDGTRQYDVTDSNFDQDYYSETDANLMPYSESYFEYPSGDYRLANATFTGNCGCGGGTSGTHSFSYTDASGYATAIGNTTYDTGWGRRTVIAQPDGTYVSQYFDETGAPLSRVITNSDPSGSPTKTWVTGVDRDSNGLVTTIHSPANCTGYTHSTGALTYSSSVGLVTSYTRHSGPDNLDGLRESVTVKEGTSGSATTTSSVAFSERQMLVGSNGAISIAQVDSTSTYPDYSTAVTTSYTPTYWSGTNTSPEYLAVKTLTTTNPTVTTGNNGSNSATTNVRYLRKDGTTAITKDEGGVLFYAGRSAYGQTATQIADWDGSTLTNIVSEDKPGGTLAWSVSTGGSGTPIQALSTMTYDDQGRMLTTTRPSVNGTNTAANVYVLDSHRFGTISFPRKVSTTYYGPASYSRVNHAGKPDQRITFKFTGGTTSPAIPSSSDWSARVDTLYDSSGMRATDVRTYTVDNSTYDTASVGYDSMGRRTRSVDATGTITRMVFDERGMVTQRWIGTDDSGWTGPTGVGSSPNMTKVEELEYDGGSAGGNGYLTERSQDSSGAWGGGVGDRVTGYTNDYRGRAIVVANPVAPHTVSKYDNSNRVTAVAQYSSTSGLTTSTDPSATSASTRVALNETFYDQRGQVYQTKRYEIVQSGGSAGNKTTSQVTDNWYDENRRPIKSVGQTTSKTTYDRLGRAVDRYNLAYNNDGGVYASAFTVSGDIVLEQTHFAIDPSSGRPLAQWLIQRPHDNASTTGSLDSNADSDDLKLTFANTLSGSRPQITSMWYDDWDRVTDTVRYGTYTGSDFNRSGLSCPSSSSTAFKTSHGFDDFGRQSSTTDPAGIISATVYDFGGRRSSTINNYVNGTPHSTAGSNNDQDRRVDYEYTNGLVTKITRLMPQAGGSAPYYNDQITTYTYGTSLSTSQVATGSLLATITYPDTTTTVYTYNALSQVLTSVDPATNEISTTYDAGGRVIAREVTDLEPGFDGTVDKIETAYNSRGLTSGVKQKNSGGTVLDEVALEYDGWGNLASSTQDPDSAIGASGRASYAMTWTYAMYTFPLAGGGCRPITLTNWTQPDGTGGGAPFNGVFNASGISGYIGRSETIEDANYNGLVTYYHMGALTTVGVYNAGYRGSFLFGSSGSSTYSTYMDRFNRPISHKWTVGPYATSTPEYVDMSIEYDLQGNVTKVTDALLQDSSGDRAFDTITTFDDLRRPIQRNEGKIVTGAIATLDQQRQEFMTRNLAGRITSNRIDLGWGDGNTTFDNGPPNAIDAGEMDDNRTYDAMNRLTGRAYFDDDNDHTGSRNPVTLTYDDNGNLTDDGETYSYVYNPWGQLVEIHATGGGALVAKYTYNGLGQRISEQTDTNDAGNTGTPDAAVDAYDPVFFIAVDHQGRRVATFRGTDTYPKETFVYHYDYIRGPSTSGGLLVRDRDASLSDPTKWAKNAASSTRAERYFYSADFRGNVIALVDDAGVLVEQYRYAASGLPYGIPAGNTDATTGAVGASDAAHVNALISGMAYETRSDFDMDGDVDSGDLAVVTANTSQVLGRGSTSLAAVRNVASGRMAEAFGQGFAVLALSPGLAWHSGLESPLTDPSRYIPIGYDEDTPDLASRALCVQWRPKCINSAGNGILDSFYRRTTGNPRHRFFATFFGRHGDDWIRWAIQMQWYLDHDDIVTDSYQYTLSLNDVGWDFKCLGSQMLVNAPPGGNRLQGKKTFTYRVYNGAMVAGITPTDPSWSDASTVHVGVQMRAAFSFSWMFNVQIGGGIGVGFTIDPTEYDTGVRGHGLWTFQCTCCKWNRNGVIEGDCGDGISGGGNPNVIGGASAVFE